MKSDDMKLWAKTNPYMSLYTHSICTGHCVVAWLKAPSSVATTAYLAEQLGCSKEEAINQISYICAMHDIGKAHPAFQKKSGEWKAHILREYPEILEYEGESLHFRHEHYSALVAGRIWKELGVSRKICRVWTTVISLHHQKPGQRMLSPQHPAWTEAQNAVETALREKFLRGTELRMPMRTDAACMLITALLILMDWAASSDLFAQAEGMSEPEIILLADKALRLYGLIADQTFPAVDSFRDLWPQIASPRPLQIKCDALSSGSLLTIIEAPMGEGKTEAALYTASRLCGAFGKRGIYMALPSQATSNQMYGRMNQMLSRVHYGASRLLHGTAFLYEETPESFSTEDERAAALWTRPARMGLLAADAVGTVDQAMASVLLSRFSLIRLAGLAGKVLIIDEIHAYDMYMSKILEILLCWCRDLRIPVLLLSATMQAAQKARYLACYGIREPLSAEYPLLTQVLPEGKLLQLPAEASAHYYYDFKPFAAEREDSVLELALSLVRHGGCAAVIVNTVASAQRLYAKLKQTADKDVFTLLFHSRFPVKKRAEIETACVKAFGPDKTRRPRRAVLIATQVVEQSIDLDFDAMISELAPMDLLLQRAGRLHRHRGADRPDGLREPVMYVLLPGTDAPEAPERRYGSSGYVYDPFLLDNTEKMLSVPKRVRVPEDIRTLVEQAYTTVTDSNREAWFLRNIQGRLASDQAQSCTWPAPDPSHFFPSEQPVYYAAADSDDGFDPSGEAATRLGDSGIRAAFCDDGLFEAAQKGSLKKEQKSDIYLNSAAIRIPQPENPDPDHYCCIAGGRLAGIWCVRGTEKGLLGNYIITNDPELGVRWEKKT